jgi:DUF2934 family protein
MAKSKRRSETASPDQTAAQSAQSTTQSAAARHERANGPSTDNGENARDRIALRAYELYLARGGVHGGDFDDWLEAERELIGSSAHPGSDRGE